MAPAQLLAASRKKFVLLLEIRYFIAIIKSSGWSTKLKKELPSEKINTA
jgi:hypothetical protein